MSNTNRLNTSAKTASRAYYLSRDQGEAFTFTSSYSSTSGDNIIYIKNTNNDKRLYIDHIHLSAINAGLFEMFNVSGTASGTSITAQNLNLTSNKAASATSLGDAAVTGITLGGRITMARVGAIGSSDLNMENVLILGFGDAIAIRYTGTSGIVDSVVRGFYEGNT